MHRQGADMVQVLALAAALREVLELGDRRLSDAETRIEEFACRYADQRGILSTPEVRRGVQASRHDGDLISLVTSQVQASPHLETAIFVAAFTICLPHGPNDAQKALLSTIASFTPEGQSALGFAALRLLRTSAEDLHAKRLKNALVELDLQGNPSGEAIAIRYRELSKELHPDKTSHLPEPIRDGATKRFIRVNAAFDLLREWRWWCRSPTSPLPIEASPSLDVGCFFCETATSLAPPEEDIDTSRCPHCCSHLVFSRETIDLIVELARPRERGRDSVPRAPKVDAPSIVHLGETIPPDDAPRPAPSPDTTSPPHSQRGPMAVIGAGLLAMIGFLIANAVFSTPSGGTNKPISRGPTVTPVAVPSPPSPLQVKRDSLQRDYARLSNEVDACRLHLNELLATKRRVQTRIESLEQEKDRLSKEKTEWQGVVDQTTASIAKATNELREFRKRFPDREAAAIAYAEKKRDQYIDAQLKGFWQEQEELDQRRSQFGGVWPSQQSIDNQASRIVQAAEPEAKVIERRAFVAGLEAFDKKEAELKKQLESVRSTIDESRSRVAAMDQRLTAMLPEIDEARTTAASTAPKIEEARRALEAATSRLQQATVALQQAELALIRSYQNQRPPSPGDLQPKAIQVGSGR